MDATIKELPVFVIQSSNWTCEIKLNEMNASFSHEEQAYEAATKAMEMFKGLNPPDETFKIIGDQQDTPYIGLVLFVYLKDTDPDKTGVLVPCHIALANSGFYKDAGIVREHFLQYVNKAAKAYAEKENEHQKVLLAKYLEESKATKKSKPKNLKSSKSKKDKPTPKKKKKD